MTKDVESGRRGEFPVRDYQDPPPALLVDAEELIQWSFYRVIITEFIIATFLFLFITVLTVIGYESEIDDTKGGNDCNGVEILGIPWDFGGMIFVLVYCIASISRGHIYPAVMFGLFLARKVSLIRAILFIIPQCLGAICCCDLVKALRRAYYNLYGGGANELQLGYSKGTGVAAENIGTFVLVYTVFSATNPKRNSHDSLPVLAPLPIGFAVFMVHLSTIQITGTGINPPRSLGAAVMFKQQAWDDQSANTSKPAQWALAGRGPFIGAAIAAFYQQYILRAGPAKALGFIQ